MAAVKRRAAPPIPDGELFTLVGRALFAGDDWPSRFGTALNLPKQTVRDIRREHVDLAPDVAAEMLAMVEARAEEIVRARDAMRVWVKHRTPSGAPAVAADESKPVAATGTAVPKKTPQRRS